MTAVVKPEAHQPEIRWPVLCKLVKQIDRQHPVDIVEAVKRLDTKVREQATAAAEATYTQRRTDEEAIGRWLLDVTGLEVWRPCHLDQEMPVETSQVVCALFDVASPDDGIDRGVLIGMLGEQLARHEHAAEQLAAALAAVKDAESRPVRSGERSRIAQSTGTKTTWTETIPSATT